MSLLQVTDEEMRERNSETTLENTGVAQELKSPKNCFEQQQGKITFGQQDSGLVFLLFSLN